MQIADFKVEQWMNDYEGKAVFNMTDTCVSPFTFQQLTAMDQQGILSKVKMDYGTITGDVHLKEEILKLSEVFKQFRLVPKQFDYLVNSMRIMMTRYVS